MEKTFFKKGLALGIILLFVGAGIIPSTVGIIEKKTNITNPCSHGYIQDLIDNASDGDTIYIPRGIYYENIVIDKSINLVGEDKDTTVIDGGGIGTVVYVSADWVNISGFTIQNGTVYDDAGINLVSGNNTITGNNVLNNFYGILLYYSGDNNNISDNIISNNLVGIYLRFSNDNIITGNMIVNDSISLEDSSNSTITGNIIVKGGIVISGSNLEHWNTYFIDISNTVNGKPVIYWKNKIGGTITTSVGQIILANCTDVVVKNQNVSNCSVGLQLGFSYNCTIISNQIFSNHGNGISLYNSNFNNFIYNNLTNNNGSGIIFMTSSSNIIINNNINLNKENGIILHYSSDNNIITGNNITNNNKDGIHLYRFISNNIISINNITNNWFGIFLWGGCINNTFTANKITNNGGSGIELLGENINNTITTNKITNNGYYGIKLWGTWCRNNTITINNITNNKNGIRLEWKSSDNLITVNNIIKNIYGIIIRESSCNNSITGNYVSSNNNYGITLEDSTNNNTIYHNNFFENIDNAYDYGDNIWDNGYPSGGNFWDDYNGIDDDGDGIGDTPHPIPGGDNEDRYPLMVPTCNVRPNKPIIDGPMSGKPGIEYEYSFNASDLNDDAVMYNVDWGDGDTDWTEYCDSGTEVTLKHTWISQGTFTIKAQAVDIFGAESDWAEFPITIPRDKVINRPSLNCLQWFMLNHPNLFPLLQKILQQQFGFGL